MNTKIKVQKISKRFQQERRAKRREKLLELFVGLHEEFEELIPAITAEISDLLCLADILRHVDRAAGDPFASLQGGVDRVLSAVYQKHVHPV